jgi:hypothetical protein
MNVSTYATISGLEERTVRRHCATGRLIAEKRHGQWEIATQKKAHCDTDVMVTIRFRCATLAEAVSRLESYK